MDPAVRKAVLNLRSILFNLPHPIKDIFKVGLLGFGSSIALGSLNTLGSQNPIGKVSSGFNAVWTDLSKRSQSLATLFGDLAAEIKKLEIPKAIAGSAVFQNFTTKMKGFGTNLLNQPLAQRAINVLTPFKNDLVTAFKTAVQSPAFQNFTQSQAFQNFTTSLKDLGLSTTNFFHKFKTGLSGLPNQISNVAKNGFSRASSFGSNVVSIARKVGRVAAIPTAFLAMTAGVENLRRAALAANSSTMDFAQYSGRLFYEQARFRLGNFQRARQMAHAMTDSGSLLADRVNQMEDAFLPFDIMRQDFSNKVGIIKANIAKAFANTVLTPLANAYNFFGSLRTRGLGSNSLFVRGGTVAAGLGGGALLGAIAGSPFGVPGMAIGAGIGAIGGALALSPDRASHIFGAMAGWGFWGSLIGGGIGSIFPGVGTLFGAAVGGAIGSVAGAVKAITFPNAATRQQIDQGPWMGMIRDGAQTGWLRPQMQIPEPPNRFQKVR